MQRRVVVHAGLGKTGTSALQRWFRQHRETLLQEGILYPKHPIDPNGVSPGHVGRLLKRGATGKHEPDVQRIKETLQEFYSSDARTLLLSSEFFGRWIAEIGDLLPAHTRFIVYVRDPMELQESNYNQGVKRAGFKHVLNASAIGSGGKPLVPFLKGLPRLVDEQLDLVLRPYHTDLFVGGSILADFLVASGIALPAPLEADGRAALGRVNRSYTLHALEFRRSINHLPAEAIPRSLDHALQRYAMGPAEYSLIPPKQYERIRALVDDELREVHKLGFTSLEPLREELAGGRRPREFVAQRVTGRDVARVARHLRDEAPPVSAQLRKVAREHPGVDFPYPLLSRVLRR